MVCKEAQAQPHWHACAGGGRGSSGLHLLQTPAPRLPEMAEICQAESVPPGAICAHLKGSRGDPCPCSLFPYIHSPAMYHSSKGILLHAFIWPTLVALRVTLIRSSSREKGRIGVSAISSLIYRYITGHTSITQRCCRWLQDPIFL